MTSSVALYEVLTLATDDRESGLWLKLAIEQIRAEPRETEARLRQEIAQIRAALHANEIEAVRKEISPNHA
jgi:hypothetical protein